MSAGQELLHRIDLTLLPLKMAVEMFKAGRMDEATLQVMNEHIESEMKVIGEEARESLRINRNSQN